MLDLLIQIKFFPHNMCNACGLGRVRLKKMTLSFWSDCQFLSSDSMLG